MAIETAIWRLLGENMRQLRCAAGVSLVGAADLIGYSKSHLCLVEQGKDRPSGRLVRSYDERFAGDGLLASIYSMARLPGLDDSPPPAVRLGELDATDRSDFVADITVPDGSPVRCAAELTKVWRIRNAGAVPWLGRRLVRYGPCGGTAIISSTAQVPIPDTQPGEEIDISVGIQAPAVPGTTMALWKMVDMAGRIVFPTLEHGLYVLITVVPADDAQHAGAT